jgi:DNA-damage-inducible protein J
VLDRLGLTPGDVIRLFYQEVAARQGLPFDVAIPNAETRRAIRDIEQGRGLKRYKDMEEMFDSLRLPRDGNRQFARARGGVASTPFRRDLKRLQKRGKDIERLRTVIELLRAGESLEPRHRDHSLAGE